MEQENKLAKLLRILGESRSVRVTEIDNMRSEVHDTRRGVIIALIELTRLLRNLKKKSKRLKEIERELDSLKLNILSGYENLFREFGSSEEDRDLQ